jgi:hypothetical protein
VPPSTRTTASTPNEEMRLRCAERSGCTPLRRRAYTVDGNPRSASQWARASSGKYETLRATPGVTAATFGSSQPSGGTSSNGANDRLAKWTSAPRSHKASASGSPAYTSNPPPAPAGRTRRAGSSTENRGGTASDGLMRIILRCTALECDSGRSLAGGNPRPRSGRPHRDDFDRGKRFVALSATGSGVTNDHAELVRCGAGCVPL